MGPIWLLEDSSRLRLDLTMSPMELSELLSSASDIARWDMPSEMMPDKRDSLWVCKSNVAPGTVRFMTGNVGSVIPIFVDAAVLDDSGAILSSCPLSDLASHERSVLDAGLVLCACGRSMITSPPSSD